MSDSPKPAANTSERVLETAARILAPLVRLLIAKGVTFQMASEVLKQVYVRVAQKQFADDDEATGTKLSLLTGLNRKEIRRLTSEDVETRGAPMSSYASAVHSVWRTQRRWLDKKGKPKVLPRRTTNHLLSFDDLVKSVTTDHRPSAILEELTRLAVVEIDSEGQVVLHPGAFVNTGDFEDRLYAAGESTSDHLGAAFANVTMEEPNFFLNRFIYSDELSDESAEALHQRAREHWQRVRTDVIEQAIEAEARDVDSGKARKTRMRVGMYFYSETQNDK
jgi:Family of unknown function (DUF6502)